ncbi:MAG: glycine cleavage system protein GcvH [Dehalococcoidia bacterium]
MNPTDYKYSKDHVWVKMDSGNVAVVGITDFAQDQLGDIVFLYIPDDISEVEQFKAFGEIESPKAVSDLIAPLSGKVTEINSQLKDKPEVINEDPYGKGWMLKIELSNPSELDNLMTAEAYEAMAAEST